MSTTSTYFKVIDRVTSIPSNTLVLVGTALDGPSNVPFTLSSLKRADEIIGQCPMADAYALAAKTGLTNIILYRLNGSYSTGSLLYEGSEVMKFTSVAANDIYDDILIDVLPDRFVVTDTVGSKRTYPYNKYPTAQRMAEAINLDAFYGLVEFQAQAVDQFFLLQAFDDLHECTVVFDNGSTEEELILDRTQDITTPITELKNRLKQALFGDDPDDQDQFEPNSTLGLMDYGVICLVDMFHDDPANFSEILSGFCQNKGVAEGTGAIGVIGVSPLLDVTATNVSNKARDLLLKAPNLGATASIAISEMAASPLSYLQIVIGDTNLTSLLGETVVPTSAAYSYAATQALLSYHLSMTNKGLQGFNALNYEFTKKDLEDLSSNGYISIVSSIRKGQVPYRAVTAIGNKDRMLASPNVVRLTQEVIKGVTDYLADYIGSTSSALKRKTMETGVKEVLQRFVDAQVIKTFASSFEYTLQTSEARVRLTIVPFSQIGVVSSTVSMAFNREVV